MSEFNFTEKQLEPITNWSSEKDTDIPEDEWEIAYFLDGYNFGFKKLQAKIKQLESKLSQSVEREGILKNEMIYFSKLSTIRLSTTMVSKRARQCLKQITEQKESSNGKF